MWRLQGDERRLRPGGDPARCPWSWLARHLRARDTVGSGSDTGPLLNWADLNAANVERVAQLLVREACGATSIDGAGRDDAQDLRHDGPSGLTIFEVKSFTKRLTKNQQRQILKSLSRAVELHHPYRWVLVIPLNPSPAELAWFDGLHAKFPGLELEWYGLDWLDGKIAGRAGRR